VTTSVVSCSNVAVAPRFEILAGLPGTGSYPEQFSTHGETYREGFVVRIIPAVGEPWVGNFQPFSRSPYLSAVFSHPDRSNLVVVAGGTAYLVDPETRNLLDIVGRCVREGVESIGRLALATDSTIIVLDRNGQWVSPPVACDGIQDLQLVGDRLTATGWFADDEPSSPIEIDLSTRQVLSSAL